MIKDGLTAEKESAKVAESKKLQAGDLTYEENKAAAAINARLQIDGISAEKSQIKAKVSFFQKSSEFESKITITHQTINLQPWVFYRINHSHLLMA